jgi:ubiquinone/menaquinone biosynthesis C-methylase UbiE
MSKQAEHANHHHYLPAMGHDRLLPLYDTFTWLIGIPTAHRKLVDQAGIGRGSRVLEIGTGTGNLALMVAKRHPGVEVIGLDPDPLALGRARRKSARRGLDVRWDLGSAADLPYESASIDRVLSSLMFHHLDEDTKRAALAEVHRVLKPGGSLHLMDFGGHAHGPVAHLVRRRSGRLDANAGDRIPERMRAAGLTGVAQVSQRGNLAYFRATR